MVSILGRILALIAVSGLASALTGCAESAQPVATGKGEIRAINAIVGAPEIGFLIEERNISNIEFRESTNYARYDNLNYNFNFDMFLPSQADPVRVTTRNLDIKADRRYTLILNGTLDDPKTTLWNDEQRTWDEADTVFEANFAHFAADVGSVDVYFAPPGTKPVNGEPIGTLSYGKRLEPQDFEEGIYKLFLTRKGKPEEILYRSSQLNTRAQTRVTVTIFDRDPISTAPFSVNVINDAGSSAAIPEVNSPARMRLVHGAVDIDNVDGYFGEDLDNVVFDNVAQRQITGYTDVEDFSTTLTLTPAGNSGTTILENEIIITGGFRRTVLLGGTLAAPFVLAADDDGRPVDSYPQLRLINLSENFEFINAYLLEPGTEIEDTLFPTIPGLAPRTSTGFFGTLRGNQELTITEFGDTAPLAGPLSLNLRKGELIDIAILDAVDPNTVELLVLSP